MRLTVMGLTSAIGLVLVLLAQPAAAKTAQDCDSEYSANKDAIMAAGEKKKDFVAACKAGTEAIPAGGSAAAPAAPAADSKAAAGGKSTKECDAEYAANKAAIKGAGQKKADFIAACKAGTETVPAAPAAATAAKPAAPPAAPAPAAAAPEPKAAMSKPATAAGESATEAQAKAKCGSDLVVWVNTKSHIYHFAGTRDYGNTKEGAYECEASAKAGGNRAAENEKHP